MAAAAVGAIVVFAPGDGARAASVPAVPDPWSFTGAATAPGGPWLKDSFGRTLQLHGVDLAAKCGGGARPRRAEGTPCIGPSSGPSPAYVLSPTARDPGRRFTAADARTLALLGFTVVRLGIVWEGLEPGPARSRPNDPRFCTPHRPGTPFPSLGVHDPYRASAVRAYLARTDRIIAELQAVGIRVLVDMHQDAYGSAFAHASGPSPWNGEGAPAWATCTGGRRLLAADAYWGWAYGDPAVQTAIDHFWRNDVSGNLQAQFARVWQAVARHYRGDPEVLGYEVINEPTDFDLPDFNRKLQCAYAGWAHALRSCKGSDVQPVPGGLIGAIESADPRHLVFYEPMITSARNGGDTVGVAEPLRFPRLVLAFHIYGTPPAGVYGCPGHLCLRSERAAIAGALRARARTRTIGQPGGPPAIMDEFGGGPSIPDIAQVVGMARRASLSWSEWSALQLHDPTGAPYEGLLDQTTRQPWPAKARVLAYPYPFATAGTPGPQRYDPDTRRFTYSYVPDARIKAPTEIVVPALEYPYGYRVAVSGATVTSAPSASLLTLVPTPGHRRVTVTVTG
jgi:endoglycosylceramidase